LRLAGIAIIYGHFGWLGVIASCACPLSCPCRRVIPFKFQPLAHLLAFPSQRLARRFLDLSTAKSASFAPPLSFSRSHRGCAPRPAQVLPDLSRYFTGALRPASG